MTLTGLHVLLTYACTCECDHCFVWSGPDQLGTLTLSRLDDILEQAREIGTLEWVYFEGGEPFLYHVLLQHGVRRAAQLGYKVGVVSNAYWATSEEDAVEWLRDLAGLVQDFSVSCDEYHGGAEQEARVEHARAAAWQLGIPMDVIRIAAVDDPRAARAMGQLPAGESRIMFRGRAAERLAPYALQGSWTQFTSCPYENLREPGRVHVDPLGHVHVCQGISIGNLFETPLEEICAGYDPDAHPIAGPLLAGGPAELARRYGVVPEPHYADACHLCDRVRHALRGRFARELQPDQMYGAVASGR